MDKLTAIKIKYDDGTYSDEIPVSVLSENVEWDSTHTLVDVLGSIDVDVTGTIQDQISQLFNEKVNYATMVSYVTDNLGTTVTAWLNQNVNPVGSAVIIDNSFSVEGAAADAKKTGDLIAQYYNSKNKYDINDLCIYNGKIYKCLVPIFDPEPWIPEHWKKTNLNNIVNDLKYIIINSLTEDLFEHGSIHATDGLNEDYNSGGRIRNHSILYNTQDIWISILDLSMVARLQIYFYDSKGNYLTRSGSWDRYIMIPKHSFFRCLLTNDPDNSSFTSITDIFACFNIECSQTDWMHGTLTNGNVDSWLGYARVFSSKMQKTQFDTFIKFSDSAPTQYRMVISYFDDNNKYLSNSGWVLSCFIKAKTKYKILLWDQNNQIFPINNVSDLLDIKIDHIQNNIYIHGTISDHGYDTFHYSNRIVNNNNQYNPYDLKITPLNNSKFVIFFYDNDNDLPTSRYPNTGWSTSNYIIPKNTNYKLMLTIDDINQYSINEILSYFKFELNPLSIDNILYNTSEYFEHGSIGTEGIDDSYHAVARIRTNIISFSEDVFLDNNGYFIIYYFNNDDSYNIRNPLSGWSQNDLVIPANTKFRLLLTQDPNNTEEQTIEEILSNFNFKNTKILYPISNNPNIIYQCRNVDDQTFPPESKYYVIAAAKNQYDRVRFTVQRSTEGIWWGCHDATINNLARNKDGSIIQETITPYNKSIDYLNQFDWGIKYGQKYAGLGAPIIEESLQYAAMFNLGVTWHFSTGEDQTTEKVEEVLALTDKYGLTDNLIVITAGGQSFSVMQQMKNHNPRISYYIGGQQSWWDATHIEYAKQLQTEYNKIYVQLYPWSTAPTNNFLKLAKENNFILYDSTTMNKTKFLDSEMINKGYGLREVNNVYMIKNTIFNYVINK